MDSLVAQYTRPPFEDEGDSQADQQEMISTSPPLSLKFAMPPMPNVRYGCPLAHPALPTIGPRLIDASSPLPSCVP